MADSYVQGSFAISCSNAEMALIEEAFQASYDLRDAGRPAAPSPEFLAAFPPTVPEDPWNGFLDVFPDPEFPDFGVDFEGGNSLDRPGISTIGFWSMTDFQPSALGELIRHCCQDTLRQTPIGFEWAFTCSKARAGEFGGGWCAVFADRVEIESTAEALSQALNGGII